MRLFVIHLCHSSCQCYGDTSYCIDFQHKGIPQSMTGMASIKWLPFLVIIARIDGSPRWETRDSAVSEGILKEILESCYGNNSFPNPVYIFGDFNKFIDGISIIRINEFLYSEDYKVQGSLKFKMSSIVMMEEPPEKLLLDLELLRGTNLWNNMIPFFIIGKNTASCENWRSILREMWRMEILNSIYICSKSIDNTSEIYTLNPITDYAPYPWERIKELDYMDVFRQKFDANTSCAHLTYDKTKILNGYNIVAVDQQVSGLIWVPGINYIDESAEYFTNDFIALKFIIQALNASGYSEVEIENLAMLERLLKGTADIVTLPYTLDSLPDYPYLFPHDQTLMIAVVKLPAEVSTLEKICQLWSTPVLIAAALALAVLFLILMLKTWSFGLALLDITRLLTYTSIQTDNRYQSFRIYFTTMLIFMVISNGVFQGKIATFLTTSERSSAPESIHELIKLGYQMYILPHDLPIAKAYCSKCRFEEVSTPNKCIDIVLNSTKKLCLMNKAVYEADYLLLPVAIAKEPLFSSAFNYKCRENWPLHDRFHSMLMRLVESGLLEFLNMRNNRSTKAKRQSMEAEWSSLKYRPVRLIKLAFAFQLLVAGLSLATIVLFLELYWETMKHMIRRLLKKNGRRHARTL